MESFTLLSKVCSAVTLSNKISLKIAVLVQCGTSYLSKSLKRRNLQTLILEALKLSILLSATSC